MSHFHRTLVMASLATSLAAGAAAPAFAAATATAIPAGTTATARLEQTLDSKKNHDGDTFVVDLVPGWFGKNKALEGDKLEGHLESVKAAGMLGKKASMALVFDDLLTADGKQVPVQVKLVDSDALKPKGHALRNAAIIAIGAGIGHHMAKKHGTSHGTLKGAAAATAVVLALPGGNIKLSKGSTVKVKFEDGVAL